MFPGMAGTAIAFLGARSIYPRMSGTDLSLYSQAKLSAIARQLNERPRKTLLYQTPAQKFAECVAAIS
jgi:IS30 family transposase